LLLYFCRLFFGNVLTNFLINGIFTIFLNPLNFCFMIIIFFGAPGVGKGTQASVIAQDMGLGHLSTGEALRAAIAAETEVGKLAKQIVESGNLVSDEVVTQIVKETLQQPKFQKGAILDGYPRTLGQARDLAALLDALGKKVAVVVNITVDTEKVIKRLIARGRKDDTEDVIRERFTIYEKETAPLLDYYLATPNLVKTVDGDAEVEEVSKRITSALA
jgi:adenylate kinase